MIILVSYFGLFKSKLSKNAEWVHLSQEATLNDLLLHLVAKYGDKIKAYVFNNTFSDVRSDVIVNINNLPYRQLQGLETLLSENDKVDLMPMFIGGG